MKWRRKKPNKKIGFINGCFDLLHEGHLNLIRTALDKCDFLIIAINSDDNIKMTKGENRPYRIFSERLFDILRAHVNDIHRLEVISFGSEMELMQYLEAVNPDIIFKQPEYANGKEALYVEQYGGEVVLVPRTPGISTSSKIKELEKAKEVS